MPSHRQLPSSGILFSAVLAIAPLAIGVTFTFLHTPPPPAHAQSSLEGLTLVTNTAGQVTHIKTPFDNVPMQCSAAYAPVTEVAQRSGNWSDPTLWSSGKVPGAGSRVQIPAGKTVTYDVLSSTVLDCIDILDGGTLTFSASVSTKLVLDDAIYVWPGTPGGSFIAGTASLPIPASITAEIVFADTPLRTGTVQNPGRDPSQYGKGLLALGGIVEIHGAPRDPTFVRLATEPRAGATTLTLTQAPTGWRVGDALIVPDTSQFILGIRAAVSSLSEERTIAQIIGTTVTLNAPLSFDHKGARRVDGSPEPGWLPHVGNLTRSVLLRSENASGVRGHVQLFHRSQVDIGYAAFRHMGRTNPGTLDSTTFNSDRSVATIGTNQLGRYAVHAHHLWGPRGGGSEVFRLIGNAVQGNLKWGITIHDSHYGRIADNVVYNTVGSSIVTEDGNESENVFEKNFVVNVPAGGVRDVVVPSNGGVSGAGREFASDNSAFWFRGPKNYVRDNVGTNANAIAFNYNGYYNDPGVERFPKFPGADLTDPNEYTQLARWENIPTLESKNNEAYASSIGFWATWYAGCCNVALNTHEGIFTGYRIWNIGVNAGYAYHMSRMTFDGWIARNDPAATARNTGGGGTFPRFSSAFFFKRRTYEVGLTKLTNFDFTGFNRGIQMPHMEEDGFPDEENVFLLANGFLNAHVNIDEATPNIKDGKKAIIQNVRFGHVGVSAVPLEPTMPLDLWMNPGDLTGELTTPSRTLVFDWNGEPGKNYEVYFDEQRPDFVMPNLGIDPSGAFLSCPTPGLTNQECWDQHGVAFAHAVAPCKVVDNDDCTAARARGVALKVAGLVFPFTGAAPLPPSPPSSSPTGNKAPTVSAGPDQTITLPSPASLDGTVSDDNLPNPPGRVTTTWTKVSGPGTVTFGSASAIDTTASFSVAGTYVLRLTASDTALSGSDTIQITVNTAPVGGGGTACVTLNLPAWKAGKWPVDVEVSLRKTGDTVFTLTNVPVTTDAAGTACFTAPASVLDSIPYDFHVKVPGHLRVKASGITNFFQTGTTVSLPTSPIGDADGNGQVEVRDIVTLIHAYVAPSLEPLITKVLSGTSGQRFPLNLIIDAITSFRTGLIDQ